MHAIFALGRMEFTMSATRCTHDRLHKEAFLCRCYQQAYIGGCGQRRLTQRFVIRRCTLPQCLSLWSLRTTSAAELAPSDRTWNSNQIFNSLSILLKDKEQQRMHWWKRSKINDGEGDSGEMTNKEQLTTGIH